MPGAPILVVDDEASIADVVSTALRLAGFDVVTAGTGAAALMIARSRPVSALVLDVMLPDRDGFEVCRRLRAEGIAAPVLFLTARTDPADAVRGLVEGGDDYLRKPFDVEELVARMQVILRRRAGGSGAEGQVLRYADVEVDLGTYRARRAGRALALTPTELRLLEVLVRNGGRVLTRYQLVDLVWPEPDPPDPATLETLVSRLRRKLDAHGRPLIQTRRGVGYGLLDEPIVLAPDHRSRLR